MPWRLRRTGTGWNPGVLGLMTLTAFLGVTHAQDWPNWLGPNADGKSEEKLPEDLDLSQVVWQADVGIGFSSFAISNGKVYTLGHEGGQETLWCFHEDGGRVHWSDSYPADLMPNLHEGGPGATPTIAGGRAFVLSKDGQLRVYNAEEGGLLWEQNVEELADLTRRPEWGFTGSPLILDDLVLVEAGHTFAFAQETGKEVWRSEKFKPAYGTPQLFESGGKRYLATLKTDGLVILDPADGSTLATSRWRTSFQTNSTTPLSIGNGRLFVSTGYDRGCALFQFRSGTLSKLYENMNMCNHMGNSVYLDGHFYGFDGTAHRGRPVELACVEAASGTKQWHVPDYRYGSVLAAGMDLVVLTERGELLIGEASPEGFSPRARQQILTGRCWTPPVLANGKLYARNAAGSMVVIELR